MSDPKLTKEQIEAIRKVKTEKIADNKLIKK